MKDFSKNPSFRLCLDVLREMITGIDSRVADTAVMTSGSITRLASWLSSGLVARA
jgi:hypothetical protein